MWNRSHPEPHADPIAELARRAQAGDREAFEQLLRRFEPGLKRVLLRRSGGQAEVCDELAQQTWIAVWEALREQRYDPQKSAISTFIYAVAHKLWLQHLRSTSAAPLSGGVLGASLGDSSAAGENPATWLHLAELLDAMRACLHATGTPLSLTADERRIVIGLSGGESERALAAKLGVVASTVHARKQMAYRKLRQCLSAKGFSAETAERPAGQRE
jgi:RNA polymerase sigma-70 factor (ECF subfamily)